MRQVDLGFPVRKDIWDPSFRTFMTPIQKPFAHSSCGPAVANVDCSLYS